MPGGFPLGLDLCNCNDQGTVAASVQGTSMTSGSTGSIYGSFVTLIAATPYDTNWMTVCIGTSAGNNTEVTQNVELAIGAAGVEKVIVRNLVLWASGSGFYSATYSFPLSIPAGTRISAAAYAAGAADVSWVNVLLFDSSFTQMEGCAGVDSLGWNAGKGTSVTGGASKAKGSYVTLSAATPRDYVGIIVELDNLNASTPSTSSDEVLIDIAVGAAGQEKVILSNYYMALIGVSIPAMVAVTGSPSPFHPIAIPAGSRVSARLADSLSSKAYGITVYGIYQ